MWQESYLLRKRSHLSFHLLKLGLIKPNKKSLMEMGGNKVEDILEV